MEYVSPEGLRIDGRRPMEMRKLHSEIGVVAKADGSAVFEMGNTKVIAAVYGPREVQNRSQQLNDQALVRCEYSMANFSTGDQMRKPKGDRYAMLQKFSKTAYPSQRHFIGLSWEPKLHSIKPSSTAAPVASSSKLKEPEIGGLWLPKEQLIDGLFVPPNDPKKLNKLLKKQAKDTAGSRWFDMSALTVTPELKKDLQLLKLRNVMDPKRHYKKGDSKAKTLPKYFQVGTVMESSTEFYSSRLTKKERKATLADELLSDQTLRDYRKRKVREIEEKNRPAGNEKWKSKGKRPMKRAKQQRL